MTRSARAGFRPVSISCVVLLAASVTVADTHLADRLNPPQLLVYSNNVENLLTPDETCPGDWEELVEYIADRDAPDLILLQQVSGQDQIDDYIAALERRGDAEFDGLVAAAEPDGGGRCASDKTRQVNAIIWNTGTMSLVPESRDEWQSLRENRGSGGGQCEPNGQSRTVNVKAGFTHRSGALVTAASVHWPTYVSGNARCADDNARLLDRELRKRPYRDSAVQIVGGDMNYNDINAKLKWCKWYRALREDAGFTDPARESCGLDRDCLARLWTHILDDGAGRKRRIDFLFARTGTGGPIDHSAARTVGFGAADASDPGAADDPGCRTYATRAGCHYSEHRAVTARLG